MKIRPYIIVSGLAPLLCLPFAAAQGDVSSDDLSDRLVESTYVDSLYELGSRGSYQFRWLGFYRLFDIEMFAPNAITSLPELNYYPLALEFSYRRSFSAEQIVRAGEKALEAEASGEQLARYEDALRKLNDAYVDVTKGDRYRLESKPGSILSLSFNGVNLVEIYEPGFAELYFKIWLGDRNDCKDIVETFQFR